MAELAEQFKLKVVKVWGLNVVFFRGESVNGADEPLFGKWKPSRMWNTQSESYNRARLAAKRNGLTIITLKVLVLNFTCFPLGGNLVGDITFESGARTVQ